MATTEAGKRLLAEFIDDESGMATFDVDTLADQIAAIEAEARDAAWAESSLGVEGEIAEAVAAERERIEQALRPLHERHRHPAAVIVLGEVLAIVRGEEAER